MSKLVKTMLVATLAAAIASPGVALASVADFIRGQTASQGRAFVAAARTMPADRYAYSSGSDQMTFAELVLHIADGNYLFCSSIGGAATPSVSKLTKDATKEVLVKRLQDSFDYCVRALASLDDSRLSELLTIGNIRSPRSMAVLTLSGSWNTHITMAQDYLSQNGQSFAPAS